MENINKLIGEDLITALCRHFNYLVSGPEWDSLLKAVFSKVISSTWNNGNLEITFPNNLNLVATTAADKCNYADWPEYFQNIVSIHEQISFGKDNWGLHLGESPNFEQKNMRGEIAQYTKNNIYLKSPLSDYSNWWVYHPEVKTVDGEPTLSFVDHGIGDFGMQSAYKPGELLLIRMANELNLQVQAPVASIIVPLKESDIDIWWNNLNQEWKDLMAEELHLEKGQVPNQKKLDGVDYFLISANSNVTTLEPLLYFKNLNTVVMQSNLVQDIAPLKAIKKLETLTLTSESITDFDVLKELNHLKDLSLSCVHFNDLNVLSNMSALERLSINKTKFDSVEGLLPLKNLRVLIFNSWELKSVNPLKKLVNLESVSLRPNDDLKEEVIELVTTLPKCTVSLGGSALSHHIINRGKKKRKAKGKV